MRHEDHHACSKQAQVVMMLGYQLYLSFSSRGEGESLASALMSIYPTVGFPVVMSARQAEWATVALAPQCSGGLLRGVFGP